MSMLKINDLRSYLKNKSNQELIKEIVELSKQFPVVKEYYRTKVDPDFEIEIFEKYKKIIQDEFFHYKGFGKLKYSNINKAIRDFKNGLEEKCKDRMNHIREDVVGVDWEFGDNMSEVYNEYFSDFDNEDE